MCAKFATLHNDLIKMRSSQVRRCFPRLHVNNNNVFVVSHNEWIDIIVVYSESSPR